MTRLSVHHGVLRAALLLALLAPLCPLALAQRPGLIQHHHHEQEQDSPDDNQLESHVPRNPDAAAAAAENDVVDDIDSGVVVVSVLLLHNPPRHNDDVVLHHAHIHDALQLQPQLQLQLQLRLQQRHQQQHHLLGVLVVAGAHAGELLLWPSDARPQSAVAEAAVVLVVVLVVFHALSLYIARQHHVVAPQLCHRIDDTVPAPLAEHSQLPLHCAPE
ncbi:uncharacterized protein SPSK_03598 [Sporothrix schenckii 1099-18]|uniref:Uncharacterized protein n=1 Tax=Sporothrix schenckii 1099-18 TaxID=1397361 RepID=A0A0F2LXH3_SPOSC|nr:uncharacterized protein SPSK_03598 [Sporothrix schenckii 1099-18]KJR82163.1 hypothetical protein SPSK_03598 [Sporothrix schenckii 1099-18]